MINRVFLIVLDSLGVGELPDASAFGDVGADTMKTISSSDNFRIDFLKKIGLSCVSGLGYLGENPSPIGAYGKMNEVSAGKDSTIGHWEISGLNSTSPFPTYPEGFPDEILDEFKRATGRGVICNKPYSGLDVIRDYGEEHMKTGSLIVYTSADSVFQIAANEEVVPLEQLYEYCRIARKMLVGKHCVGRVIARPFVEVDGKYVRTKNRHDFSVNFRIDIAVTQFPLHDLILRFRQLQFFVLLFDDGIALLLHVQNLLCGIHLVRIDLREVDFDFLFHR